jgi:hypothetical protein
VAHLRGFFLQRHTAHQIIHASRDRQRRILKGIGSSLLCEGGRKGKKRACAKFGIVLKGILGMPTTLSRSPPSTIYKFCAGR